MKKLYILECSGVGGKPQFLWSTHPSCKDLACKERKRLSQKKRRQIVSIFGGAEPFQSRQKALEGAFAQMGWELVVPSGQTDQVKLEPEAATPGRQDQDKSKSDLDVIDLKYLDMQLGQPRQQRPVKAALTLSPGDDVQSMAS